MPRFKELKDVWGQFEVLRRCGSAIGDKYFRLLPAIGDAEAICHGGMPGTIQREPRDAFCLPCLLCNDPHDLDVAHDDSGLEESPGLRVAWAPTGSHKQ